jgi:hypothetical protein
VFRGGKGKRRGDSEEEKVVRKAMRGKFMGGRKGKREGARD